jgi:hypothetical protein
MTDDKKHDDKDRKRLSDEELKDVAGGLGTDDGAITEVRSKKRSGGPKGKKKPSSGIVGNPYPSPQGR